MTAPHAVQERAGDLHLRLTPATRAAVAAAARRDGTSMSGWVRERVNNSLKWEQTTSTEFGVYASGAVFNGALDAAANKDQDANRAARRTSDKVTECMASTLPIGERGPLHVWPLRMAQADIDLINSFAEAEGLTSSEWARRAFAARMFGTSSPHSLPLVDATAPASVASQLAHSAERLVVVIGRLAALADTLGAPE